MEEDPEAEVPDDDQINEMMSTHDSELLIYQQIDRERRILKEKQWNDYLKRLPKGAPKTPMPGGKITILYFSIFYSLLHCMSLHFRIFYYLFFLPHLFINLLLYVSVLSDVLLFLIFSFFCIFLSPHGSIREASLAVSCQLVS